MRTSIFISFNLIKKHSSERDLCFAAAGLTGVLSLAFVNEADLPYPLSMTVEKAIS